jgi:hypothetical protein
LPRRTIPPCKEPLSRCFRSFREVGRAPRRRLASRIQGSAATDTTQTLLGGQHR